MLASGVDQEMLPKPGEDKFDLFMPRVDFDWMTISFSALPHQVANMRDLCDRLKGRHDLLLTTLPEQFEAFVKAASEFGRIKEVRSGGTVVALLTELALETVRDADEQEENRDAGVTKPKWTRMSTLFGRDSVPTEAAATIERALQKMAARDELGPKNKWQALEYWAAGYLSSPDDA